jgi:opacity protein-like surface antigen
MPLGEDFEAFVRGGYSFVNVDVRAGADIGSKDVDGFAVGGGLQFNLDSQSGIRAGYTYKDMNIGGTVVESDVWDVSYVRKF